MRTIGKKMSMLKVKQPNTIIGIAKYVAVSFVLLTSASLLIGSLAYLLNGGEKISISYVALLFLVTAASLVSGTISYRAGMPKSQPVVVNIAMAVATVTSSDLVIPSVPTTKPVHMITGDQPSFDVTQLVKDGGMLIKVRDYASDVDDDQHEKHDHNEPLIISTRHAVQ